MNIRVLSLHRQFHKNDKTQQTNALREALSAGNSVELTAVADNPLALEYALSKAVKGEDKPDCIIVADALDRENSEQDFRGKFAFIISRGESKVQEIPSDRKKTDFKALFARLKSIGKREKSAPKDEIETVTYFRKKTRVFALDCNGKTAYAFPYCGTRVIVLPKDFPPDCIADVPRIAKETFEENAQAYPEGYSLNERTLRVLTFAQRHLPIKSDSSREKIRKSVMLLAVCVFLAAGCMFVYNMFVMPMQNDALQSEIRTIFYEGDVSSGSETKAAKAVNWKKLKKINSDIKGWIKINNTKIDYPVLQCKSDNEDSQFYLTHNYKKESSGFGGIFIDYRSKKGMKSKNVIIHGHHMDDGSMFANLTKYGKYSGDLSFYKKNPVVKISTPTGGTEIYKIISVFKTNVNPSQGEYFDFYCGSFKSDAQFMNYVYNLRIRSLIDCPVSVNEDDRLLTLVTCSYEFNDFRTAVVARKCREGESAAVDTGGASLNKKPLWPQCYYSRYGGTRPTVSTFKAENKKGNITWYDGDAKLKGSEQLPTSLKETTEPTTETVKPTEKPTYTVKFYSRGKVINTQKVKQGKKATPPTIKRTYTKGKYKYTFVKWKANGSLKKVTKDTKVVAKYKKTKIKKTATTPKKTTASKKTTQKATKKATQKPAPKPTDPATAPEETTEPEEVKSEE